MKRLTKTISALVLGAMLTFGSVTTAFAGSSVTYEGKAENFVFLPGSEYTNTDLFNNFKGVMPGDKVTQDITVKNNVKDCDYVNIYMRAIAHDENGNPLSENVADKTDLVDMNDFLSKLSMTVYYGDKVIYNASPDELDGLKDNVYLGSFEYGDEANLTVELNVPIELDNSYATRIGEVDWVFVAEEFVAPKEDTEMGDNANLVLYAGIAGLSAVAIILLAKKRRSENK